MIEQNLAVAEMAALDLSLRFVEQRFEAGDLARGRRRIRRVLSACRPSWDRSRFEDFIVEREELAIRAGVALPAAAADELAVDALRFVQLGADDVQAAELVHAVAKANVGAAAGHVRGDGDFALLRRRAPTISASCATCRALSTLCSMPRSSSNRESISLLSIERVPTSTGRPSCVLLGQIVDDRLPFVVGGAEDQRRQFLANRRPVGRNWEHAATVDLVQLAGARGGGARHAGQAL